MSQLPPIRTIITSICLTFVVGFQMGFGIMVVNPLLIPFRGFMNSSFQLHYGKPLLEVEYRILWSLLINVYMIGGLLGAITLAFVSRRYGRRALFLVSSVGFGFGTICCAASKLMQSFELYMFGRCVSGFMVSIYTSVVPMYIAETVVKRHRGTFSSLIGLHFMAGSTIATLLGVPRLFGSPSLWPVLHWIQLLPVVLGIITGWFMPETPNYLMSRGKRDQAREAAAKVYGDKVNLDGIFNEIASDMELVKRQLNLVTLWKHSNARTGTIVACVVNMVFGFGGTIAVMSFSTYLLRNAGFDSNWAAYAATFAAALGVVGSVACILFLDKFGRRPILLGTLTASLLLNTLIMVSLLVYEQTASPWATYALVGCLALFSIITGFGPSPISMFIAAELVPINARAAGQSVAIIVRFAAIFTGTILFFPLDGYIGPYSYLLFIVPLLPIIAFLFFNLPETKKRNVVEILETIEDLPNAQRSIRAAARKTSVFFGLAESAGGQKKSWGGVMIKHRVQPMQRARSAVDLPSRGDADHMEKDVIYVYVL